MPAKSKGPYMVAHHSFPPHNANQICASKITAVMMNLSSSPKHVKIDVLGAFFAPT
jgi:hypothetical protein